MKRSLLTADVLLAGATITHTILVPPEVLHPGQTSSKENDTAGEVSLKPLSIGAFQLIQKAARQDNSLIPLLMVKESLVEPSLSMAQVKSMPVGLVRFLVEHIRSISGLSEKKSSSI